MHCRSETVLFTFRLPSLLLPVAIIFVIEVATLLNQDIMKSWKTVLIFLAFLIQKCRGQTCTSLQGTSYNFFTLTRPTIDPLTGNDTLGSLCVEDSSTAMAICSPSLCPPLIDGDLGPEGTDYTSSMVHTWHRSTQTVNITYTLPTDTAIQHVNLYFYSFPSMGIGLPNVALRRAGGVPIVQEYYITGNSGISPQDSTRHNVLLSLTEELLTSAPEIHFDFENTNVEWLVLSETELCTFPAVTAPSMSPSLLPYTAPMTLSADDLSPNLTLSCTVMGEGRFSWQWTGPDGNPPSAVILSDVTRTSIAVFTSIVDDTLAEETGDRSVTYRCEATYKPMVPDIENSAAQNITILLGELEKTTNITSTERTNNSEGTANTEGTTNTEETTVNNYDLPPPDLSTIASIAFLLLLLLLVGLVAGVLILWRCKHHKHHHTAKEEASHTTCHTHPAVSLCEETGQLQYASDQDNPSHMYSTLQHQGRKGRGGALEEIAMTEYSTLQHQGRKGRGGALEEIAMMEYSTLQHQGRKGRGGALEEIAMMEYSTLQSQTNKKALDRREDAGYSTIELPKTRDGGMQERKKAQDHKLAKYSTIEPHKSRRGELQASKETQRYRKEVEYSTIEPPQSRGGGIQASKVQEYHKYFALEPLQSTSSETQEAQGNREEAKHSTTQPPQSMSCGTEGTPTQHYEDIDEVKANKSGTKVAALAGNSQSLNLNKKMKSTKDQVALLVTNTPSSQPPEMATVDQLYTQVDKKKVNKEKKACLYESEAVYSVVNKPSPPQLPPDYAVQYS